MPMRRFTFSGILTAGEQEVKIAQGVHADDLPEGDAGKHEIVERVRRHYGEMYGDPDARWKEFLLSENLPGGGYTRLSFPEDLLERLQGRE